MTDKTIESPLAQMRKTGKIGGKPAAVTTAEPTAPATPEQRTKKTKAGQREKLQVYITPDLAKWVRHLAVDQAWEISEVVEEALQQYRARLQST